MFIRNVREKPSPDHSFWASGGRNHSILKGKKPGHLPWGCLHDATHRSVLHRCKYTDQTVGVFWTWLEKCVFKERQSHFFLIYHGYRF